MELSATCKRCKKGFTYNLNRNRRRGVCDLCKKKRRLTNHILTNRKYRRSEKGLKNAKEYSQQYREKIRKENKGKAPVRKKRRTKEEMNKRLRERWEEDSQFRISKNISRGIRNILGGSKNCVGWERVVGYTIKDLKKHLEKQFKSGMTWDNYGRGGWHIDHKVPKSAFNFTKPEHADFKRCWALKNLQPLWEKENMRKGANLITPPF